MMKDIYSRSCLTSQHILDLPNDMVPSPDSDHPVRMNCLDDLVPCMTRIVKHGSTVLDFFVTKWLFLEVLAIFKLAIQLPTPRVSVHLPSRRIAIPIFVLCPCSIMQDNIKYYKRELSSSRLIKVLKIIRIGQCQSNAQLVCRPCKTHQDLLHWSQWSCWLVYAPQYPNPLHLQTATWNIQQPSFLIFLLLLLILHLFSLGSHGFLPYQPGIQGLLIFISKSS